MDLIAEGLKQKFIRFDARTDLEAAKREIEALILGNAKVDN
ncbi:MAG: hypothetical protein PHC61_14980 [Chitinivibrionales bacterium]|nr:hypothetical protein [Chitinivibrionales bacterium]